MKELGESNYTFDQQDEEVDKKAHHRLLDAVGRLHKTQYIKKPIRNEPSFKRNEFHLVKTKGEGEWTIKDTSLAVPNLVKVLQSSKKLESVGTALKKSLRNKKTLQKPLEKPVAERINRSVNYEKAKKKLNQWNAVVAANRAADHMSFPIQKGNSDMDVYVSPLADASNFRIKSNLMIEMEKTEVKPDVEVHSDNEDVTKLTRKEMIARSKELRLIRIRESQKNAKARLQKKIKSKKFHKIMKKEKLKEEIKNFQLMQKSDPEAAMRKLDQLEKRRIEERALLRHKNTGTWAKNLQIRSKYDKEARKELAQQLSIGRELTQVNHDASEDDDDVEETVEQSKEEETEIFNPWVKQSRTVQQEAANNNSAEGYRKYWNKRNATETTLKSLNSSDGWSLEESTNAPIEKPQEQKPDVNEDLLDDSLDETEETSNKKKRRNKKNATGKTLSDGWTVEEVTDAKPQKRKLVVNEDFLDDIFDKVEETLNKKVSRKLNELQKSIMNDEDEVEIQVKRPSSGKYHGDLNFKKKHSKPSLDEELNETQLEEELKNQGITKAVAQLSTPDPAKHSTDINPEEFMKTKKIYLKTTLPDIDQGEDDETDAAMGKQLTIAEAFEDDDILNDFEQENAEENEKKKPKDIDLTLPGWGKWGGSGIKAHSKKLILKFPKEEKRREENKGHVIIVDEKNDGLRKHQVSSLPFPFTSVKDYEAALRAPVGRDFVPEIAHNLLTKPAVTTKLGTIIKPIDKDVLFKPPKKHLNKTEKKIAALEKKNKK
ncbi:U3 small nucleolar RNA-associated protein 14 like A [Pseudolycoriella hygida]|uniref:U3 small nucleolar RNA-associated protein 14 like A n=1 Tax=Pseudolycoriella hygida TaxID=35572 RepID=A0A9Q0NAV4_9DIPT|nr:U3 small nucleolar RNA-associated protein 14 like A [Pseudolycoriella hygida]